MMADEVTRIAEAIESLMWCIQFLGIIVIFMGVMNLMKGYTVVHRRGHQPVIENPGPPPDPANMPPPSNFTSSLRRMPSPPPPRRMKESDDKPL